MLVLGIDTACDDTSAAVVEDGHNIRSNVVWTQKKVHERFGGVVPELAARRHVDVILYVVQEALDKAGIVMDQIDAIGVNCKHGLLRSVIVGVSAAKALSLGRNIPLVGVHHVEGHIYSTIVENPNIEFPHLCLTVSGGHNLLVHVLGHGEYELIGRTIDDAAGEAFDKVAKLVGLGFPGGQIIDQLARTGNLHAFNFPRPLLDRPGYDFSFSGLKTAVIHSLKKLQEHGQPLNVADLAASFQQAVVEVLVTKTMQAAVDLKVSTVSVAGGVSANSQLRAMFQEQAQAHGMRVIFPPLSLCTDNGAMIASLAFYKLKHGIVSDLSLDATPNAPLGSGEVKYKSRLRV
jgi:N6-L-threonylcarbamoyladenine synthase